MIEDFMLQAASTKIAPEKAREAIGCITKMVNELYPGDTEMMEMTQKLMVIIVAASFQQGFSAGHLKGRAEHD